MPQKSTAKNNIPDTPRFKNEAEEADWWASPAGRRYSSRQFQEKMRQGKIITTEETSLTPELRERMKRDGVMVHFKHGLKVKRTDPAVLEELTARAQAKRTQAVSLRLPVADIAAAKKMAEKTGKGYQTILKDIIHEGLRRVS